MARRQEERMEVADARVGASVAGLEVRHAVGDAVGARRRPHLGMDAPHVLAREVGAQKVLRFLVVGDANRRRAGLREGHLVMLCLC